MCFIGHHDSLIQERTLQLATELPVSINPGGGFSTNFMKCNLNMCVCEHTYTYIYMYMHICQGDGGCLYIFLFLEEAGESKT